MCGIRDRLHLIAGPSSARRVSVRSKVTVGGVLRCPATRSVAIRATGPALAYGLGGTRGCPLVRFGTLPDSSTAAMPGHRLSIACLFRRAHRRRLGPGSRTRAAHSALACIFLGTGPRQRKLAGESDDAAKSNWYRRLRSGLRIRRRAAQHALFRSPPPECCGIPPPVKRTIEHPATHARARDRDIFRLEDMVGLVVPRTRYTVRRNACSTLHPHNGDLP
jgi:hypothetical protein